MVEAQAITLARYMWCLTILFVHASRQFLDLKTLTTGMRRLRTRQRPHKPAKVNVSGPGSGRFNRLAYLALEIAFIVIPVVPSRI